MKAWFKENQVTVVLMVFGVFLMSFSLYWSTLAPKNPSSDSALVATSQLPEEYLKKSKTLPSVAPSPLSSGPEESFEYSLEYVQNTVKAYQKYFQKCYTLALQKERSTAGSATLKFEIAESGVATKSQVLLNTIQTPGFEMCLLEALSRVPFRSHQSRSIQAILPLTFR